MNSLNFRPRPGLFSVRAASLPCFNTISLYRLFLACLLLLLLFGVYARRRISPRGICIGLLEIIFGCTKVTSDIRRVAHVGSTEY
jgi:hypothetical protein